MLRTPWLAFVLLLGLLLTRDSAVRAAGSGNSVTLKWTAPGDDGVSGRATLYELRYSRNPITSANFSMATPVNTTGLSPAYSGVKQTFTVYGFTPGITYYFALRTRDDANNWSPISNVAAFTGSAVDIGPNVPMEIGFSSPWPNPAHGSTRFQLSLPSDSWLRIEAFDVSGRMVSTIALGEFSGGTFDVRWDLRDDGGRLLGAGTYLVRGQIGDNVFLRRVTIVR
jgi:FlgD Ig-like domain